ncbi:lamin tail domain-containing protein [Aeoliella sp. ICT_H6.2]|uniref:Lamin tail domain-containing protein n=1 Tax=Aeoliella straminimaris TaxID=2954799 RepID=A0A9X2FE72_9BACT|nr:lamin tail domain-containing protein [Aeoliella straminimaris]MCO6047477.1 lamin tail domain-containing protein [Aeoliella straminimaris]
MHHRYATRLNAKHREHRQTLHCESLEPRLALTVVINEFLAGNDDGLEDLAGHRHDWIELKNTGPAIADVSGWYLTDDSVDLAKWQIPSTIETTSLAPGETLLVFASGNNGEVGLVGSELHTNFQLSREPGYLGLVQADGSTIESEFADYPHQSPDVSYGLGVGVETTLTETLLSAGTSATGDGSPAMFRPFTGPNAAVDDHWTDIDYLATAADGWTSTTNGLGYGYGSPWQDSNVSLAGEIAGYARMPFSVMDAAQLTSMSLDLRVDNGFIVYLNGREIGRQRVPTMFKIGSDWTDSNDGNGGLNARQNVDNSTITGSPATFDLTPWLDTIVEGTNVLAVYAANHTSDTGDYLVHAELTSERAAGAATVGYMVTPTPDMENGAGYLGLLADTAFSHDRGFYDASFDLTITAVGPDSVEIPDVTIRYTVDGSMPTLANGSTYAGPIKVDPATLSYTDAGVVTVRAAAFKDGYFSSNVDTQTYVFLDAVLGQDGTGLPTYSPWGHAGADWDIDPTVVSTVGAENLKADLQSIPTMSLVMDWEELFGNGSGGDDDGIYTQDERWRNKSDERFASLEYFTADQTEEFQIDSLVEIQGHSSTNRWRSDKLSFEVKFKQPYDTKLESASLFGNSVADGANAADDFDSLVLDAQYNYTFHVNNTTTQGPYATYVHDQVVADLQNLAGGEAPHGRWVHLYINGLYWGIYNAHERPTDAFAEEYYGGDKDDYLVVKGFEGKNLVHGGTQGKYLQADGGLAAEIAYQVLLDEVDDNLSDLNEYQDVAERLDVDSFIDYMVVLFYAGNYDWGELNWFASLNGADPNGQWHFHSWDQEHAFPNDQNAPAGDGRNQDYDQTELITNDFGEHEFGPTGIHQQLMASEEYRLRFSDRVQELMHNDGLLTPANAQAVWQARVDEISGAINAEAARWGDNRTPDKTGSTWATNVQYTSDHFFFANGPYASRTDIVIDIFNHTISSGVGKTDWLVDLVAPTLNQYGGEFTAPFDLVLANPNGGGIIYYTTDGTDPRAAGGGIGSTAVAYTGSAVQLTAGARVRARVLDTSQSGTANDWSAEVDETFVVAERLPLRIVELMYNPAGSGASEYIELLNSGSETIDLAGVQITDFSTDGFTFSGGTLAAGERIVVAEDLAAFQAQYPAVGNVVATAYAGSLSNGGETITLVDSFGTVLQSFTYDDLAPWPSGPDGGGSSLEYVGPLTGDEDPLATSPDDPFDDSTNWQASAQDGGSPGVAPPSVPTIPGDYDASGTVDQLDYVKWKLQFGTTVTPGSESDGSGDGMVDLADYVVWRNHLGATLPIAALQAATPTSSTLLASEASPPTSEPAVNDSQQEQSSSLTLDGKSARSSAPPRRVSISSRADASPHHQATSPDALLLLLARDRTYRDVEASNAPEHLRDREVEISAEAFASLAEYSLTNQVQWRRI